MFYNTCDVIHHKPNIQEAIVTKLNFPGYTTHRGDKVPCKDQGTQNNFIKDNRPHKKYSHAQGQGHMHITDVL